MTAVRALGKENMDAVERKKYYEKNKARILAQQKAYRERKRVKLEGKLHPPHEKQSLTAGTMEGATMAPPQANEPKRLKGITPMLEERPKEVPVCMTHDENDTSQRKPKEVVAESSVIDPEDAPTGNFESWKEWFTKSQTVEGMHG
ncbi:Aste57867_19111 [Aphanomyces stellatus]|uniref:Aste57867_19111 protein n=1 Tax=Aphanomyces stellatus TaxID=120398 RepID=A0A485LC05_9STRA|nr:hypothetical protein As57867_019047 [Aphanomyces stellatus]VFT95835.1 Aste57867_19111 [Aphanomyces stellatus]